MAEQKSITELFQLLESNLVITKDQLIALFGDKFDLFFPSLKDK